MERIVGRDLFIGHPGGGFDLVNRQLGNGHTECLIQPIVTWEHVGVLSDLAYEDRLAEVESTKEERHQANLERAANRAKQRVRHLCKVAGIDTLLTLTYAANMTDWDTLKLHVKEFNRRMSKAIPGWFYVAAFERQKRGAWHVHMAIHRLPAMLQASNGVKVKSFNVVRSVWRAVAKDFGGNIDVQAKKRNSDRAPSRIAGYISKYMTKAFAEGDAWKNRFSSSKGITVPKAERIRFAGYSLVDMLQLVFDHCLHYVHTHQINYGLSRYKDGAWFIVDTNIAVKPPREVFA
jgi:hypothetical protein